jgi:hypothetical protein
MAAPSEEKLICDKFNLEALTVNQVKSFKALADRKDVFIGTKTGSGIFAYISSITCAPCKTSSDWICVLHRCQPLRFFRNCYEFRAKITVLRSTVYLLRISDYCRPGTVPHLNII